MKCSMCNEDKPILLKGFTATGNIRICTDCVFPKPKPAPKKKVAAKKVTAKKVAKTTKR